MELLFYGLAGLSICVALGLFYRISITLFAVGFNYACLIDKANYLNHFYLIGLLSILMIFIPCHRSFSVDAILRRRTRPGFQTDELPAVFLWMLRLQIAVVYVYGGIAKCSLDWIRGEPLVVWLGDHADLPVIGPFLAIPLTGVLFSWFGLLLDLFIAPLLLWSRTRIPAVVAVLGFHLMNSVLFGIGIFPYVMICSTILFLPPDFSRRLGPRKGGGSWAPWPPVAKEGPSLHAERTRCRPISTGPALVCDRCRSRAALSTVAPRGRAEATSK